MAYINQETKRKLTPGIKAVLARHGVKGSIGIRHNSTLVVKIKEDKLGIIDNWYNCAPTQHKPEHKPDYLSVNVYYPHEHYTGKVRDFLVELVAAMKGSVWYDKSDSMTDYYDTAYYLDIQVGNWR